MIRIEHIALWCEDIERLKHFYETYFDATANDKYHNPKKQFSSYFLTFSHGARVEIMQSGNILPGDNASKNPALGYAHFAVSLGSEDAVDELTHRMKSDGIRVIDGPRRTGDGYYESVILDPEGNAIELTV